MSAPYMYAYSILYVRPTISRHRPEETPIMFVQYRMFVLCRIPILRRMLVLRHIFLYVAVLRRALFKAEGQEYAASRGSL